MNKKKQTTTQPISAEGYIPVAIFLAIAVYTHYQNYGFLTQLFLFSVAICVLLFFRNPERISRDDSEFAILAPTDGVVKLVEYFNDSIMITIHTKLQDAHVLRAPVKSSLISQVVRHGAFLPVDSDKAALLNESYVTSWKSELGFEYDMSFTLGSSPARITLYPELGSLIRAGERIAFVRSELKTVIKLPKTFKISIGYGDKVLAGESVVGYVNERAE